MILRRLSQSLKEQNWMAISIELVLLVVGVFLGIQVANWNEERVERELVRGHLSEIAEDLRRHMSMREELDDSARLRIAALARPRAAQHEKRRPAHAPTPAIRSIASISACAATRAPIARDF